MLEGTEDDAKRQVISEIENADDEEKNDYPANLDMDPAHVTCRRMTSAEVDAASKSAINTSWWG